MTDPLDRRCTARSKRSGERCKRAAVVGGTVCAMHGGKAPRVKAAAERRVLEQKADQELGRLWAGLASATPVKDPVGSMERLAGALEQLVDETGRRVDELNHLSGGEHLTQLRGEVVLFERALNQLRQVLDAMARLGIAERHIELEQGRAELVIAAFLEALRVLRLVPADRDVAVRAFLGALGRSDGGSPGAVVAGELGGRGE